MNKVILIGRLTADPEIRYTQSSKAVASYRLAVDRAFKSEGQPEADFISCIAWGKSAEFCQKYLHKGTKIAIDGRIQTGSYEKDGQKHYTTDVIVDHHEFCESKGGGSGSGSTRDINELSQYPETQFTDVGSADDGELPF